jgi:hypothetical protein
MLVLDFPPELPERLACAISAAVTYEVPANIVLAVAGKEDCRPGQWKRNDNGTHDVGPTQVNRANLRELSCYGITANDVARAGRYSFEPAAWRLRKRFRRDNGSLGHVLRTITRALRVTRCFIVWISSGELPCGRDGSNGIQRKLA